MPSPPSGTRRTASATASQSRAADVRVRRELSRQFAPYVGVEWPNRTGETADRTHAAGEPTRSTHFVAGVRFRF
ncbi:MAG: copper resistance protein B [Rubrivivax sp.]